jgi:hypothetical protein
MTSQKACHQTFYNYVPLGDQFVREVVLNKTSNIIRLQICGLKTGFPLVKTGFFYSRSML